MGSGKRARKDERGVFPSSESSPRLALAMRPGSLLRDAAVLSFNFLFLEDIAKGGGFVTGQDIRQDTQILTHTGSSREGGREGGVGRRGERSGREDNENSRE